VVVVTADLLLDRPLVVFLEACLLILPLLGLVYAQFLTELATYLLRSSRASFKPTPVWLIQGFFLLALLLLVFFPFLPRLLR
jgi:hypothetical protein